MRSSKIDSAANPYPRLLVLAGGDLLSLLLFTWVGRSSHTLPGSDITALLVTAAPFVISWFALAPLFRLFGRVVSQTWQKFVPRILLLWLIGGPLAGLLRAVFLGRPIPEGIIPTFVLITMAVAAVFMLAWRLGYGWWANRTDSLAA